MLGMSWKVHKTDEFVHGAIIIKARVGPQEKKLIGALRIRKLVWFTHHSPQKPRQNAARNTRGRQKTRATGKVLGRQLERVGQTEQLNPDEIGRGQTCLAFCSLSDNVSSMSPLGLPSQGGDQIWSENVTF